MTSFVALFSCIWMAQQSEVDMSIEVQERILHVQVLEKGRFPTPVHNLKRDQFELWVDGETREISYFEELHWQALPNQQKVELFGGANDAIEPNYLVVLIDSSLMRESTTNAVTKSLVNLLADIDLQNTFIKIVHIDHKLTYITPFTNSKDELQKGLNSLRHHGVFRKALAQLNHSILASQKSKLPGSDEQPLLMELEKKGEYVKAYYQRALNALLDVAYMLSPLPGSKSIIHMTADKYRELNGDLGDPEIDKIYEYIIHRMNLDGTTMHTFFSNDGEPSPLDGSLDSLHEKHKHHNLLKSRRTSGLAERSRTRMFETLKPMSKTMAAYTGGLCFAITNKENLIKRFKCSLEIARSGYRIGYVTESRTKPDKINIRLKNNPNRFQVRFGTRFVRDESSLPPQTDRDRWELEGILLHGIDRPEGLSSLRCNVIRVDHAFFIHLSVRELDWKNFEEGLQVGASATDQKDYPLGYKIWQIHKSDLISDDPLSLMIRTDKQPSQVRLLVRNPSTKFNYIKSISIAVDEDYDFSPIFLMEPISKNRNFLPGHLKPIYEFGTPSSNPFILETFSRRTLQKIPCDEPFLTFFFLNGLGELGPGFVVNLLNEADEATQFETQINQIQKINDNLIGLVCRHQPIGEKKPQNLVIEVIGDSGKVFRSAIPLSVEAK